MATKTQQRSTEAAYLWADADVRALLELAATGDTARRAPRPRRAR
jgi:hypothetical protein